MSNSLRIILSDTRFPSGQPPHSGGVEVACAKGLIKDTVTLRAFLRGRLGTSGTVAAFAAASVCHRAGQPSLPRSVWRSYEAELDARIHSPAGRAASRHQGGGVLRLALTIEESPVLDSLARATVATSQRPHHAVALGAVAAAAGATPVEAASAAAYASVAGPAYAAQELLRLNPAEVAEVGVELAPEIGRLASAAADAADNSPMALPCVAAPALEFLSEEHFTLVDSSYAS